MQAAGHLIVFGAPYSVYVRAVRPALEEKSVPYEVVPSVSPLPKHPRLRARGLSPVRRGVITRYVSVFLARENWVGRVAVGAGLAEIRLPTETALQIAIAMATDDRITPHGVAGYSAIVFNPDDPEGKIGFGQHGGLGAHEQHPFLIAEGGWFAAGVWSQETSLMDIAPTVLRHLAMDHDDMDGWPLPRVGS
jgi:hypothetical protein